MTESDVPTPPRILVVDADRTVAGALEEGLAVCGFATRWTVSASSVLDMLVSWGPDLVLIDAGLPGNEGLALIGQIRERGVHGAKTGIIVLSARNSSRDRVTGLRLGADDYVTKPFAMVELVERLKAVLRRSQGNGPGQNTLRYADLVLDGETREVWRGTQLIDLTRTEFRMIEALLTCAPEVMSRAELQGWVWPDGTGGATTSLETYISCVRRKLASSGPPIIETVRGVGYALRAPGPPR